MSSFFEALRSDEGDKHPFDGLRIGIVSSLEDPTDFGRVKVRLPWLPADDELRGQGEGGEIEVWARLVTPAGGKRRGFFFLPEVDDEVLIGFESGSLERPFVLGSLWDDRDEPPEMISGGRNDVRSITSRSGHVIRFNDTDGDERVEICAKDGSPRIVLHAKDGSISIEADKDVTITSKSGAVVIKGSTLQLEASGKTTLKGASVDIN